MGSSQVRREWTAGEDHAWITAAWTSASAGFRAGREKALLYGERAARPVPRRGPRVQWPRKAVVLAAGFGTRMNPLSGICAKPLMPLWGKPALQHVLESLASWGVEEVVINSHHQPGQVLDFVRGQPLPGMKLDLSYEPDILGTGGALRKLSWFLGEEPFWMMNADVAADLDPRPLVEDFGRGRRLASLWLHADAGPRTVEMDRSLVRTFRSRRAGSRGTYTFTGLHLLSKDVLDYLPESGFATIIGAYEAGMKEGRKVGGVHVPGAYWRDLGSPDDYIRAHREVRVRFRSRQTGARLYDPSADGQRAAFTLSGVRVGGFLAAAPGVELAPGAAVKDSVLWPNVRVGPRARIEHAVVGDGATVSGPVTHIAAPAVASLDEQARDALRALGMNAARATWSLIGVRGSQRTFSRVSCGGRSVVLVQYSRERKENLAYARYARFLGSAGFPVPDVLLDRPRQCLTILQDLGDRSLEETVRRASPRKIAGLYGRVLESVALLHTRATGNARACGLRLQPPFTRALYRWENDLFAEEFLAGRNGVDARRLRVIKQELRANAERLLSAKRVLLHRDLQSSNVLLTARGHAFIDFQGMRMGAAAYDLASLLCDPYVSLGREQQEALLDTYVRLVPDGPEVRDLFWPAAVQRLAQALGAFARLSRLPDNARFEQYIPAGMAMLGRAARCVGGMPELRAMLGETDPPQAPGR
jgi:NDP-sugar pyrophosphorylase family protein/aminoglycoside/choline kinase family phosphotransferase